MKKEPLLIAFASQKGGVGKTAFTVLTAGILRYQRGYNVAVVDCDPPQHSIGLMRDRDLECVKENDSLKMALYRQYKQKPQKAYPIIKSEPENAVENFYRYMREQETEFDIVLFDLPRAFRYMGPWKSGGVLVDSRAPELNQDGTALQTTNAAHNTHGSIEQINGQWYVFYHRPPRGSGFARQSMVAPIKIEYDEKSVAEGGKVIIRAYDPYRKDNEWTARSSNGEEYTGAEVTSEGFHIYGLDPYQ